VLKQVLEWAREKSLVRAVPKVEQIPSLLKRLDLPSPQEVALIIKYLSHDTALLIRTFAETGLRKSELFSLRLTCH
jgi:integrase